MEGRNYTEQAEEIVDGDGNRAVLTVLSHGRETTVIFSYDTQEILYITGEHRHSAFWHLPSLN